MKKILFAAIAALTLFGTVPCWAAAYQDATELHFVTRLAANPTTAWDSVAASRVGAQSAVLCTTTAIGSKYFAAIENTAAGDSTSFMKLFVVDQDGASCESGADSLYIATQVSADGITWANPGTFVGGTRPVVPANKASQADVAGQFRGVLSQNGAALAAGAPVWSLEYYNKDLSGAQTLDDCHLAYWPFIRFIIGFPDAKGYKVKARVAFRVSERGN